MMGLGKAQKQKRNLEAKLLKRKEEKLKMKEEELKIYNEISSMKNNRSYSIESNGKMLLDGIFANGKLWKMMFGVPVE